MPTVTFSRKTVEKILGKQIEDELLKDRISYLGTDLEKADEEEIVVEIFPNRPDMLSEYGFARALSSFMKLNSGKNGSEKGIRRYSAKPSNESVIVKKEVNGIRPFTVCAIVKNLNLNDEKIKEIIQIQEKLHVTFCRNRKKAAIGIYPLEKIKFPITYTAKNPEKIIFRPLEASKEMNALEILENHHTGKEYGHLLQDFKLFPVFLDAKGNVLSVPPIINSEETGRITENTKEAFIECSGSDINTLNILLGIIATAFIDMGAEVYSIEVKYESYTPDDESKASEKTFTTPDLSPKQMDVDYNYINKWLGLSLKDKEIDYLLAMMGIEANNGKASIPAYRADILHSVDLAEDVAIAYGYENFSEEIPKVATIAEENPIEKIKAKIAAIVVGLGAQEVNTYHLANKDQQCSMMNCQLPLVELENALNQDYNVLRGWVIPSLLKVLAENKTREFPQKIFDIGVIFKKSAETETGTLEHERIAVLTSHAKADFSEAKESFDYLMRMLGLKYEIIKEDHPSFIPGRVARISVNEKKVAYLGEIHPKVLSNFNIEMPVSGFELNLTEIFEITKGTK